MSNLLKGLIALSCLAFVIAVLGTIFNFNILSATPEGFSRASSNLALIAIAFSICFKTDEKVDTY